MKLRISQSFSSQLRLFYFCLNFSSFAFFALYELMVSYIQSHYDPDDGERFNRIRLGIEAKQNAEIRRNLFTGYMTQTEPETREMLRRAYLSEAGIEEDRNDDF